MAVAVMGGVVLARVYKAHHRKTNAVVAIKAISTRKLDKKAQANLESEISILQRIRHENIVRLFEIQKSDKYIYLILEYCGGGDLSRLIHKHGPLPEERCQALMKQLARGIEFLWTNHLIHRDLKPQNLLLTEPSDGSPPVLKIADFGFARHLSVTSLAETLCGSPLYMAPEILRFQRYDAKADLWSVGAILFEMLAKRPPFTGANYIELLANIEKHEARLPPEITVSPSCLALLQLLLRRNPLMRISFQEFFASPFLQDSPEEAPLPALPASSPTAPPEASPGTASIGHPARQRRVSTVDRSTVPLPSPSPPSAKPPTAAFAPSPTPAAPGPQPSPGRPPTGLSVFGLASSPALSPEQSTTQPSAAASTASPTHPSQSSPGLPSGLMSPSQRLIARLGPSPAIASPSNVGSLPPPPTSPGLGFRRSSSENSLPSVASGGRPSSRHHRRQSAPSNDVSGLRPLLEAPEAGGHPTASGSSEEGFIVVGGRATKWAPSLPSPMAADAPGSAALTAFDTQARVMGDLLSALAMGGQASAVAELGRKSTAAASGRLGMEPMTPADAGLIPQITVADVLREEGPGMTPAECTAAVDKRQADAAKAAYGHALALYLKAARLFERALRLAHSALQQLGTPAVDASSRDLHLHARLADVCRWLRTCFSQCSTVGEACLRHIEPDTPLACAEDLVFQRAMQAGRSAAAMEVQAGGGPTPPDCLKLYGEAVTLLRLLSSDVEHQLVPADASSVAWFLKAFSERLQALEPTPLPTPPPMHSAAPPVEAARPAPVPQVAAVMVESSPATPPFARPLVPRAPVPPEEDPHNPFN